MHITRKEEADMYGSLPVFLLYIPLVTIDKKLSIISVHSQLACRTPFVCWINTTSFAYHATNDNKILSIYGGTELI